MGTHQFVARCACGYRWNVLVDVDDATSPADVEAMATCTACGADTFELEDAGEIRSAGRGS